MWGTTRFVRSEKVKTLFLAWTCLLLAIPCSADIISVDPNGTGDYPTIQAAIDAASVGDTVIIEEGITISDIALVNESEKSSLVSLSYEKNLQEQVVYSVYEAVAKNLETIRNNKVDFVLPEDIFVSGDKETPGSKEWFEMKMNEDLGAKGLIKISTYNSQIGLEDAARINKRDDAVLILGVTEKNISKYKDSIDEKMRLFLNNTRVIGLPDMEETVIDIEKGQGLSLTGDIIGAGLVQASLTKEAIDEAIDGAENIAQDMAGIMAQLTGNSVDVKDLYYLLPFRELASENVDFLKALEVTNSLEWVLKVVKSMLLRIPIEPFDIQDALERRREVMWSA